MVVQKLVKACATGAIVMGLAAIVSAASALPLQRTTSSSGVASGPAVPVELVHGCHRGIQKDYPGWHYHNRACVRVPTAPPGLYDNSAYRRYYRTPTCRYQCRFIGPVKTCQQVCR